jgi:hypothetical protein
LLLPYLHDFAAGHSGARVALLSKVVPSPSEEREMFKNLLSVALGVLLLGMTTPVPSLAQSPAEKEQADKIRAKVTRLGTGKRARVEIKLKDNTRLKGYIGQIAEEKFALVDPKHGTVTPVPYDQVQQIKNTNLSGWYALAIAPAIIGGLLAVVALALRGS